MDAHNKLLKLVQAIQDKQKDYSDFRDKLEVIDKAYAEHEISLTSTGEEQPDEIAVKVPVVNSEIDDNTSYLTGIFVNQSPLFPVIAEEGKEEDAMMLQAIISKDARQQRWGRQLLKFITSSCRYNVGGIEVEKIEQISPTVDTDDGDATDYKISLISEPVTKLKAIDMYNALFDYRVDPADVVTDGEYVGYNEIVSRTTLKAMGNAYAEAKTAYNLKEAYASSMAGTEEYWNEKPDISTITPESDKEQEDWFNWLGIISPKNDNMQLPNASYFITRLYVRIIPKDFGISVDGNSWSAPSIIKLTIVNNKWIINYQEVITPLNMLPILLSDTREDGFGYQTKSAGENVMPYQRVATELLHTRLGGAKRALNDRAIFNQQYLDETKVNSRNPTAKIPLKTKLQNAGDMPKLHELYHQIPFDSRGTEGAIADLGTVLQIKDQVNGNNFAFRGEQVKGNRTKSEFDSLSGKAEGKALPTAIRIEQQVMIPMKLMIKINILTSNLQSKSILDEEQGNVIKVDIARLRKSMLGFRLTDGLLPKTAIKDPEVLNMAMQVVQSNEQLAMTHDIGGIFTALMGVLDIDISKYKLAQQPPQAQGDPNARNTPGEPNPASNTPEA